MDAQAPVLYTLSKVSLERNTPVRLIEDGWVEACPEAESVGLVGLCYAAGAERWRVNVIQHQRPSTALAEIGIDKTLELEVRIGLTITRSEV